MDLLLHKIVSAVITAVLLTLVSALSVAARKRKVRRAEATAPAPTEDPTQTLLREARHHELQRDESADGGQPVKALQHARAAADRWRALTEQRPGRFLVERRTALARLAQMLDAAGYTGEADRVRSKAAALA
ncbi:hypothetical protein [Kitasatospora sp. NPDC058190]|uniref:hypothetical protein n=1 Tax=Kitasatospora sp. NPDC058190 TaxID=3346371 RepID=UPI0036DE83C0